jgi:hypothetical protein
MIDDLHTSSLTHMLMEEKDVEDIISTIMILLDSRL